MTIDPELEAQQHRERSAALCEMLDAGHPVVVQKRAVLAESKRLGEESQRARREAAARVAAGLPAGCPVGLELPIRHVVTDRLNRDVDPFHGAAVVTDALIAYWGHRRDVVAPAVESSYRQAAVERPYREALVAAAHEHIGLLRERRSMLSEGGAEVEGALARYDEAFLVARQAALDSQAIAGEAVERLASLRREAAKAEVSGDQVTGFIASAVSMATDSLVDAKTGMPLVPTSGGKEAAVQPVHTPR
jgi:hypothetical protein